MMGTINEFGIWKLDLWLSWLTRIRRSVGVIMMFISTDEQLLHSTLNMTLVRSIVIVKKYS